MNKKKKKSATSKKTRKNNNRFLLKKDKAAEFFIVIAILFFALLFWDSFIIYPVKILVVALHEISHAIITIFTGGSILKMEVHSGLYGTINSEGGNEFLIAFSGYLGSLLFGYFIFVSAENKKLNLILSTSISVLLLLFTANFFTDAIAIIFMLFYTIFFYVSPRYLPQKINYWAMRIIGLISTFYALFDIKEDLLTNQYLSTDADRLAIITNIPSIYWGLLWFVISIFVILIMFRNAYFRE